MMILISFTPQKERLSWAPTINLDFAKKKFSFMIITRFLLIVIRTGSVVLLLCSFEMLIYTVNFEFSSKLVKA